MAADTQAYTGFAGLADVSSEWNRMEFMIRSVLNKMATTTIVKVIAVRDDGAGGYLVDVQPMVSQTDGAGNAIDHGTIHNMPVWRLQGGDSAFIVKPVAGDIGVATFASTDISGVKRSRQATTPGSARRFDWADGIYFGGLLNAASTQFIRLDEDGVTITAAAGRPVTINAPGGATVNGDLTVTGDIMTGPGSTFNGKSFDDHVHSGVTTGGGQSGPPV